MKFIRRILIALTALLLLAVITVALWMALGRDRLYSSPRNVRENSNYKKIFAAAASLPSMPDDLLSRGTILTNDPSQPSLEISFPETPFENRLKLPFEMIRGENGAPVKVGDGTIQLEYIGIAYSTPKTNFDWSVRLPMRVFDPQLQPVSLEGAFPGNRWERELDFQGTWPQIRFVCSSTNFEHLKILGWDLFDATTHWTLVNSRSYGLDRAGRLKIEGECKTWRPVSAELAIYLAAGPVTETLIKPESGAEVRSELAAIKLVGAYDADMSNWSSSSNGKTNTVRLSASRNYGGYDPGPISTFAFLSWPDASPLPVDIEALNHEGKVIPAHGGGSSDKVLIATARAPLAEIHQLRVRSYQKVYKVILPIPEIPGLPEENRNLDNLFDTQVPFMRIQYEHELQNVVKDLVQMNSHHLSLVYPNGYFPITFTNTTAREIFQHMASLAPEGNRLVPNPEKNHIEVVEPPLRALWKRVKSLLLFK